MSAKPENRQTLAKRSKWRPESIFALIVAVLPLVGFAIFNGFPLIISFIGMFCNVDLYTLDIQWNDFNGFKAVFVPGFANELFYFDVHKYFMKAVWVTLWIASTQVITLVMALITATLLRERRPGSSVFQILFFIPYICSTVAVSLMWRWIFTFEGGILNDILGTSINWMSNVDAPWTETICIIIAIIWQAPGYGIVMYKAAFANINDALYDAAAIDGANAWHKFWHVTLPGISPTTFFLLQAGVGAGLLTYDLAQLIIPNAWGELGGRDSMGLTLVRLVRELIANWTTSDINGNTYMVSCACIISWLLFVVTGAISMFLFRQREKSLE